MWESSGWILPTVLYAPRFAGSDDVGDTLCPIARSLSVIGDRWTMLLIRELSGMTMKHKPSTEAAAAWIRLIRIKSRVLDAVERDLKKVGFPPLAWYDALLELSRAPSGEMRPVELERQMLIPQYSTSRLIDGLVDEGLAARRECKIDRRGQLVEITETGRELQKKMWNAYSAAIEKHVGSKLSDADAVKLCSLLDRLGILRSSESAGISVCDEF
jgi:DNA-binding MarR family transcriptional regulator